MSKSRRLPGPNRGFATKRDGLIRHTGETSTDALVSRLAVRHGVRHPTPGPAGPTRYPFCLLALRLWPAVRCAQGHGVRCAPGPRARKLFPPLAALAGETLPPDLALRAPLPAQISSARRQKNGRQRPSPKGTTAMTDTITADPGHGTDSQDGPVAAPSSAWIPTT